MNQLIKQEIAGIINQIQRHEAPHYIGDEGDMNYQVVSDHLFDLIDSHTIPFVVGENQGTAHYINGREESTYALKVLDYDEYMHRLVYDDGKGNTHVSRLQSGVKVADFIIYTLEPYHKYFIIQEISDKSIENKQRIARKQLSDTLNQLFKSGAIATFISQFEHKYCFISAKDDRKIVNTEGMADGFMKVFEILPHPKQFNFGQIGTYNFQAYETSFVNLP